MNFVIKFKNFEKINGKYLNQKIKLNLKKNHFKQAATKSKEIGTQKNKLFFLSFSDVMKNEMQIRKFLYCPIKYKIGLN